MVNQGFVGFFDILGYQGIIDNNDIEKASKVISEIFEALPEKTASGIMMLAVSDEAKTRIKLFIDIVEARLISDSILLAMPVSATSTDSERMMGAFFFLFYVAKLMRLAFNGGLPLRGAIDRGDFFLSKQCFAGKPIIDCYRLGSSLELTGCAITKECVNHIEELAKKTGKEDQFATLMFSCLVTLKGGTSERYTMLDWYLPYSDWGSEEHVRSSIIKAFQSHNKDISAEVMQKINNSEIMIMKSLIKRP